MRKSQVAFISLILGLLTPLPLTIQAVNAATTPDGAGFPLASGINITSPINTTYPSGRLMLNISIRSIPGPIIYNYEIAYSLDGKDNVTMPVTATFVPVEATAHYANGTTAKVISAFYSYYLIGGCVTLPELTQDIHNITVYEKCERKIGVNTNWPALLLDKNTVEFAVNKGIPPKILDLSLENKTYTITSLPLNFTTDKPTLWKGYCLDEKVNVTITGNTTLTGLSYGSHCITIYANDTFGNMGASEKVCFEISQLIAQQPEITEAVAGTFTATVMAVAAVFVIKRKKKTN